MYIYMLSVRYCCLIWTDIGIFRQSFNSTYAKKVAEALPVPASILGQDTDCWIRFP
jgi:hypothetical protein